jgi:hypothetical protein
MRINLLLSVLLIAVLLIHAEQLPIKEAALIELGLTDAQLEKFLRLVILVYKRERERRWKMRMQLILSEVKTSTESSPADERGLLSYFPKFG